MHMFLSGLICKVDEVVGVTWCVFLPSLSGNGAAPAATASAKRGGAGADGSTEEAGGGAQATS